MKTAAICTSLLLALSAQTFAFIRPRYPAKPMPPYSGQVIIIGDDSIRTVATNPPAPARK